MCVYLLKGNPSQRYRASSATVLPATWHRWTCPALTPARQTGTRFTYPGETEGWVDLGGWLYTEMVTCPQTVTQCSSNHLIVSDPTRSWTHDLVIASPTS